MSHGFHATQALGTALGSSNPVPMTYSQTGYSGMTSCAGQAMVKFFPVSRGLPRNNFSYHVELGYVRQDAEAYDVYMQGSSPYNTLCRQC